MQIVHRPPVLVPTAVTAVRVEAAEIALVAAKMWAPFRHTHFPEFLAPAFQLLMQIVHHRDSYSALLGSGPDVLQSLHDYTKEDIKYA
jgi:hypothetical protein